MRKYDALTVLQVKNCSLRKSHKDLTSTNKMHTEEIYDIMMVRRKFCVIRRLI